MVPTTFQYALHYAAYLLELAIIIYVLRRGYAKRLAGVTGYVAAILATSSLRSYVLYRYGFQSPHYAYFYWFTDILLTLGAFLLVCALFRRACAHEEKLWLLLRFLLVSAFILTTGISFFALTQNYARLFTRFIVEFQQNLYFTCLVLNTLLYILIQQFQTADDELSLLVCGLGIQFAGPAANLALVFLTPGQQYASTMMTYLSPMCTLGMLLTWFYAVARGPKKAEVRAPGSAVQELAAAAGREA